jgi:hypothetical protein
MSAVLEITGNTRDNRQMEALLKTDGRLKPTVFFVHEMIDALEIKGRKKKTDR